MVSIDLLARVAQNVGWQDAACLLALGPAAGVMAMRRVERLALTTD